jgi:tetratricopeptide (TPR) repeat protein
MTLARASKIGLLTAAIVATIPSDAANAQFGGICGRQDGCGVSENDFRIREPVADAEAREQRRAANAQRRAQNAANRAFDHQIDLVNQAHRRGDLEGAIRLAEEAQAQRNDSSINAWIANIRAVLYSRAASTALRNGEYSNALALYERALQNPAFLPEQMPDFLNWLRGEIALRNGNRAEALRLFRLGSRTPWTSGENSRRFLERLEAEEQASVRWDRNIAEGRILLQQGRTQVEAGDLDSAERTLASAERLAPLDHDVRNLHRRTSAELVYRRGDIAAAIELLRDAYDDPAAIARLAELQRQREQGTAQMQQASGDLRSRITGQANGAPAASGNMVDARGTPEPLPSYVPRPAELTNSPGVRQWEAGMRAVIARDFTLALAYFKGAQQQDPANAALASAVRWIERVQRDNYSGPGVAPPPPAAEVQRRQMTQDAELGARVRAMLPPGQQAVAIPDTASLQELIRLGAQAQARQLSGRALGSVQSNPAEAVALLDQAAALDPSVPNYARTADWLRTQLPACTSAQTSGCNRPPLDFIRR